MGLRKDGKIRRRGEENGRQGEGRGEGVGTGTGARDEEGEWGRSRGTAESRGTGVTKLSNSEEGRQGCQGGLPGEQGLKLFVFIKVAKKKSP